MPGSKRALRRAVRETFASDGVKGPARSFDYRANKGEDILPEHHDEKTLFHGRVKCLSN